VRNRILSHRGACAKIARLAGCQPPYITRVLKGYPCSPRVWDVISDWLTDPDHRAQTDMTRAAAARLSRGVSELEAKP